MSPTTTVSSGADAVGEPERRERRPFSLTQGGPFLYLLRRLHIDSPTRWLPYWLPAIAVWLPLVIGEGVRVAMGSPLDPMLRDISLHVRLLLGLPVLLVSERLLERTSRSAITSLYNGQFCDPAALDRLVDRVHRLRDSWIVEAALLGVAFLGGQLVLWEVFGATGLIHGGATAGFSSFGRVWYAVVALPLVQFVMYRWLWRWLIWIDMLVRISRLPLTALATHPDLSAGLSPLSRPVSAFSAFVFASSAVLAGAWGTKVLADRTTLEALLPQLLAFLVAALVIAVGPLLLFCGQLFRVRRRGLAQYGDFARSYTVRFHLKWIEPTGYDPDKPLGSPDIQSLNDLGQSFQVVSRTRGFVFGPRTVFAVWFAGMAPMIPLFASSLKVEQVLRRIVTTILGGFPL